MGYYRGRRSYGGYRRYRRRRYYDGGGSGNPIAVLFILFLAGVILSGGRLLIAIIPFIIFAIIIYGIYKLLTRHSASNQTIETSKINFQSHTERDFFNGTNDGENQVASELARGLDHEKYYILNNVTIPSEYNGSSQIDHIVVSRLGIFIIETKDYQGWIFGGENQTEWTQSLPGGRSKFQFQNPLRQNWGHMQSLKGIFPSVSDDMMKSIVVFTNASEYKTPMPENVVNIEALVPYITKFQAQIIPEDTIYTVVGKLTYRAHTNHISTSKHVENLLTHHN